MSEDRITQSVLDALEDLQIVSTRASLLDEELETLLRSKFPAGDIPPVCPLDDPTLLERLHFLTTCLQREALIDRKAPVAITEDLSEAQCEVVRSCQEYLQADYERRRQHMRQRFDVLKETFDNPEDVMLLIDKADDQLLDDEPTMSQFLLPSTNTSSQHAIRQDAPSTTLVDRGGRVMQEENRNSMPEFSAGPRQAGGGSGGGRGGRGNPGRGNRKPQPSEKKKEKKTNESSNKDSLTGQKSQVKGEKVVAVAELASENTSQATGGRGGRGGRGNPGRGKRNPQPSNRQKGNNTVKDENKDTASAGKIQGKEKKVVVVAELTSENKATGGGRGSQGGGKRNSQSTGRKKQNSKTNGRNQNNSLAGQGSHPNETGQKVVAVAELTSENKAQATAGGKSQDGGKRNPQPSGGAKENNKDKGDRMDSSAGNVAPVVSPEAVSEHGADVPVVDSSGQPNNKKTSNNRNRGRKKPAPK